MHNVDLGERILSIGNSYSAQQANAATIPTFRTEIRTLLTRERMPQGVIDEVLKPLDGAAVDQHTGNTAYPYLACEIVKKLSHYGY